MPAQEDGFQILDHHALMLLDEHRVDAYARAIRAVVKPGHVVADIGTGTGILAAIAARAGASRVFAVERGPMAEIAEEVLRASGLEGVVELVRADARDVTFPVPPDVLVSETLGSFGIDEDIVGLLGAARKQCGNAVRILPSSLQLVLAPLEDRALAKALRGLEEIAGIGLSAVRDRMAQRVARRRVTPEELLGTPCGTGWIELGRDPLPGLFAAELKVEREGEMNAVAVWFRARLAEGIVLASGPLDPPTHWVQTSLPLDPPLRCRVGDIVRAQVQPRLVVGRGIWAWEVVCGEETRTGDTMRSVAGGTAGVLAQLGLGGRPIGALAVTPRLRAWAAALEGRVEGEVEDMARRVLEALPDRYADHSDAVQEVRAMLAAADALA